MAILISQNWFGKLRNLFLQNAKESVDLRDKRDPQQLGEALQVLREQRPDVPITHLADELDIYAKDDADLSSVIQAYAPSNNGVGN